MLGVAALLRHIISQELPLRPKYGICKDAGLFLWPVPAMTEIYNKPGSW
jgi:hypothetical protein